MLRQDISQQKVIFPEEMDFVLTSEKDATFFGGNRYMSKLKNHQNINYLDLNVKEDPARGIQGALKSFFFKELVEGLPW